MGFCGPRKIKYNYQPDKSCDFVTARLFEQVFNCVFDLLKSVKAIRVSPLRLCRQNLTIRFGLEVLVGCGQRRVQQFSESRCTIRRQDAVTRSPDGMLASPYRMSTS